MTAAQAMAAILVVTTLATRMELGNPAHASVPGPAGSTPASPLEIRELAIETSASRLVLPTTATGTLVVRTCAGCAPRSLLATTSTRYANRTGTRTLSLDELRDIQVRRPAARVVVFHTARTREVTRVVVTGAH